MKHKEISNLEQQVMNVVWEKKDCSIRDVWEVLSKDRTLAYNTVGTILQRLTNKGLLVKKALGSLHIYKPKVTKQEYLDNVSSSFIKKLVSSYGDVALASFADGIEKLPKEKKDYLITLIESNDTKK